MPVTITNRMSRVARGRKVVMDLRATRSCSSVASMELDMFSRGIRASQLAAKYPEVPEKPWYFQPPPPPPLPVALQIALLTLRNSDHGQQILKAMFAKGERAAVRDDYAALVPLGLAIRDKNGFHSITPIGTHRAGVLAHELATTLGVRLVNYRRLMRGGRGRVYGMSDSGNA